MPSSEMWCHVGLARTDISRNMFRSSSRWNVPRNVCSNKTHTAPHCRIWHSSWPLLWKPQIIQISFFVTHMWLRTCIISFKIPEQSDVGSIIQKHTELHNRHLFRKCFLFHSFTYYYFWRCQFFNTIIYFQHWFGHLTLDQWELLAS
jgi:hypothetical protein